MKNPNVLRYGGLAILVIVVAFGVFFFSSVKKQEPAPIKQTAVVETKIAPSITTKTYVDDAGFQFDYPDDLIVAKKESTSSAVYTSVEVSSQKVAGRLSFVVEDTKSLNVDDWIAKNITGTTLEEKSVTLGNIQAKIITQNDKTIIVAIDQKVLFKLEVSPEKENEYWNTAFATVLSSFSFSAPQTAPAASVDTSSVSADDVVVEEDIVE